MKTMHVTGAGAGVNGVETPIPFSETEFRNCFLFGDIGR